LIGSGGNNVFLEEAGINQLVGAGGHDTFGFYSDLTGSNTVLDFHVGDDKLAFVGTDTMHDLSFTQTNAGTLIHFDNTSGSVLLVGVNAADLVQHASTELVFPNDSSTLLHG
jgi:Ca2+-binding RTX toxin-like protein